MSYQIEKEENGDKALVISGFENGIADSPYGGIANMRNVGIRYYPGVAYVNYKRQAATISGGTMTKPTFSCQSPVGLNYILDSTGQVWKQSSAGSSTFNLLTGNPTTATSGNGIAYWNNYLFVFRNSSIDICGDGTGDGGITYANWNANVAYTLTTTLNAGATSATISGGFSSSAGTYTIFFSDGEQRQATITNPGGAVSWSGGLTNNVTANVAINSNLGVSGYTLFPLGDIVTMTLSGSVVAGGTSATISSYTDPSGVTGLSSWTGATGTYQMTIQPTGVTGFTSATITVTLTYGSPTIQFSPSFYAFGTTVQIKLLIGNPNMSLVSRNDGNLYFCNGNKVGSIFVPTLVTTNGGIFNPHDATSFAVNYSALGFPRAENTVWLEELTSNLIIATNYNIYSWNRVAFLWQNPVPIKEKISKMINIMNNLYIFAGNKGNIYLSNGYSIFPFKKIPDYVASGTGASNLSSTAPIDPQWTFGGMMQHIQKLFFQATASTSGGTKIMSGIFSLSVINPTMITGLEGVGALTIEAQNSFGLNNSGTLQNGLLIDDSINAQAYNNYYSAWATGSSVGGIDYNDTTLWSGGEPWIETDIIPVGTFLLNKTFSNMEFKLDQPMKSGDSISVYARNSLSDTYVLVGTTSGSTLQLSDSYTPLNFQRAQWVQFAISMTCNATATLSSFMRLKEIRIR